MEQKTFAEIAYEAYRRYSDGKSLATGQNIPPFTELPGNIKEAWSMAGEAVHDVCLQRLFDNEESSPNPRCPHCRRELGPPDFVSLDIIRQQGIPTMPVACKYCNTIIGVLTVPPPKQIVSPAHPAFSDRLVRP